MYVYVCLEHGSDSKCTVQASGKNRDGNVILLVHSDLPDKDANRASVNAITNVDPDPDTDTDFGRRIHLAQHHASGNCSQRLSCD
jgi:hypothetical protein